MQKMILSANLEEDLSEEDREEKIYFEKKKDKSYFPEEMDEDSSENSESSIQKRARHCISPLTEKNFQWFKYLSQRTFTLNSVPNFNAKGKG